MEDGLNPGWKKTRRHVGVFGGYTVQGEQYVGPTGEVGWHTSSWPMRDPIHCYWVSGSDFYTVRIHVNEFRGGLYRIDIPEQPATSVDSAEREAILEAIEKWEASDNEQLLNAAISPD
jgi:hypothetical protein